MRPNPITRSSRSPLGLVRAVLCGLLLVSGVMLVGVSGASAYQAPNIPSFSVETDVVASTQVVGDGWGEDSAVTIERNGVVLGLVPVSGATFTLPLYQPASVGDLYEVTGMTTGFVKEMTVVDLAVTDFGTATPAGTKGAQPDWGALQVWLGNMWNGVYLQQALPADGQTSWQLPLTTPYDLMHGTGLMLMQQDADGDILRNDLAVPNPTVQVQTNAVSLFGWAPGSTVMVSLDADGADPYDITYPVTVNNQGDTDCCEPPPGEDWQVLLPGYRAKAVGESPGVTGEVTKEVTFPEPATLPLPTATGNTVTGSVSGTLTATSMGVGSNVQVNATCGDGSLVWRAADATGGSYFADFGAGAQPPYGEGTCAPGSPLFHFGTQVADLDGDTYDASWFAESMFDETHPALAVDGPVDPQSDFRVHGTGWDLTALDLEICEVVEGEIGECDASTFRRVHTWPDGEGWPSGMAIFDAYLLPTPVISVGAGDREVDCTAAPGTCAVVATETLRPAVSAWAPLEYLVPVALVVDLAPKGTVSTVSGNATVSGVLSASQTGDIHVYGEVRQRLGRTRVVVGGFDVWVSVDEASTMVPWQAVAVPWTGQAFGSGFAEVQVWTDLGEGGYTDGAYDVQTVKLTTLRPRK